MRLVDVEQVYCADCEYKNKCAEVFCDVPRMPTINPADLVPKGRWEVHPQDTFAREHHCEKLRCAHCWHFFYRNYGDSKLYCPNCGARMVMEDG